MATEWDGVTRRTNDSAHVIAQLRDHSVVSLLADGVISTWNTGAEALTGWSAGHAIGRSYADLFPPTEVEREVPLQLLRQATDHGRAAHVGWRLREDGSRFWATSTLSVLTDQDQTVVGYAEIAHDTTAQHHRDEARRRTDQRVRLLVSQVRDYAIFAIDERGCIESWNAGAQRLKGWEEHEVVGMSIAVFYTQADQQAGLPEVLLAQARHHGTVEHTGWRVRKDGSLFWADVVITCLYAQDGTPVGFAKVTRDLTMQRKAEEAQRNFYQSFAHDFLTPVSALQGYAYLLRDADPAEVTPIVDRIENIAERLGAMMRDLVDHSQQRAHAELPAEEIELPDLVDAVQTRLGDTLDTERISVEPTTTRLFTNRHVLERALSNVVDNALKYSHSSPVQIRLTRHLSEVRLEVVDQGRGVHPDDVPRIFDERERGRLATRDGGTGLGLTSVRRLVADLGGTVMMTSTLGVGTCVSLTFPAGAVSSAPHLI